jgi:hypothetical protein
MNEKNFVILTLQFVPWKKINQVLPNQPLSPFFLPLKFSRSNLKEMFCWKKPKTSLKKIENELRKSERS